MKKDKQLHLIAGAIISFIIAIFTYCLTQEVFYSSIAGVIVAGLAGAVKEIFDSLGYGQVEGADFWYTFFGGLGGSSFYYVIIALYISL